MVAGKMPREAPPHLAPPPPPPPFLSLTAEVYFFFLYFIFPTEEVSAEICMKLFEAGSHVTDKTAVKRGSPCGQPQSTYCPAEGSGAKGDH